MDNSNCGFFGGTCAKDNNLKNADVLVVPVPYEASTSYMTGTKFGPGAIISASSFMESYDIELDYDIGKVAIYTADVPVISRDSMGAAMDDIKSFVSPLINEGKFTAFLGGEHSITPPIVESVAQRYKDLSVLHFDAHSDMRDSYEGTKFSHACAIRRTREICPVIQLGIRSMSHEESLYIKEKNIGSSIFYAKDLKSWDIDAIINSLTENVYISFDFDAFDPSIMPSVGTPEPGGMLWYDTLAILRKCFEKRNVVACDFVELMPSGGHFNADFLAASLVYKFIAYKFKL